MAAIGYGVRIIATRGEILLGLYEWRLKRHRPIRIHESQSLVTEAAQKIEELKKEVRKKVVEERWKSLMEEADSGQQTYIPTQVGESQKPSSIRDRLPFMNKKKMADSV